jgi:HD superfamily phosphohydrolase
MHYYIPKIIRIPIDGMVDVSDYLAIINSSHFQRLREISQLDVANYVYPGAKSDRFEHSVGTLEKFRKMFVYKNPKHSRYRKDDLSKDEKRKMEVTALLHDTPHGPFAHLFGYVEQALTGKTHDDRFEDTIKKHYEEPLAKCGFSADEIIEVSDKNNPMREIIWGRFGADKLDYLPRDAYHVGWPLPDIEPFLTYAVFRKSRGLCIEEKNATNAVNFITDYCTMHKEVYWRKACLIAATMMRRAFWYAIQDESLNLEQLQEMTDWEAKASLMNCEGRPRELMKKILLRQLYKTAIVFKVRDNGDLERDGGKGMTIQEIYEEAANKCVSESRDLKRIVELEADLSKELGTDIIISTTPDISRLNPGDPKVISVNRKKVERLSDINRRFYEYQKTIPSQLWSLRITTPNEDRKRVSKSVRIVRNRLCLD